MNKQNKTRLNKALEFLDSMDENSFEAFLIKCTPNYSDIETNYNDIELLEAITIMYSANDTPYDDTISEAA